jgi:hypothetical protein
VRMGSDQPRSAKLNSRRVVFTLQASGFKVCAVKKEKTRFVTSSNVVKWGDPKACEK